MPLVCKLYFFFRVTFNFAVAWCNLQKKFNKIINLEQNNKTNINLRSLKCSKLLKLQSAYEIQVIKSTNSIHSHLTFANTNHKFNLTHKTMYEYELARLPVKLTSPSDISFSAWSFDSFFSYKKKGVEQIFVFHINIKPDHISVKKNQMAYTNVQEEWQKTNLQALHLLSRLHQRLHHNPADQALVERHLLFQYNQPVVARHLLIHCNQPFQHYLHRNQL